MPPDCVQFLKLVKESICYLHWLMLSLICPKTYLFEQQYYNVYLKAKLKKEPMGNPGSGERF